MNFGFSGPMDEREMLVEKFRERIDVVEHLHRVRELNELLGNDGGIVGHHSRSAEETFRGGH